MLCCLCLKDSQNITCIFGDNADHQEPNIAKILIKHICWFEPPKDDSNTTAICKSCRKKLCDFHEFYEMVEVSHQRNLNSETVTVKTEGIVLDTNDIAKYEADDDFDELDEIPLSTVLVETKKSITQSVSALETKPIFNHDTNDENNDCYDNEFDINDINEIHAFQDDSEQSDPFDDTQAIANEIKEEPTDINKKLHSENRKIRYSKKHEKTDQNEDKQHEVLKPAKRGRKPKVRDAETLQKQEIKTKKQKNKDKPNKDPDEKSAYKSKMKSFDDEITQYMGLACDVCNIAIETFAGLKTHMRTEHKIENGYVKCCDKKFHKRANLLYHIRIHVNPNVYRCEECDHTFSDSQSLRNHLFVKHQKEEDKIYQCPECSKKFAKKYLLEQHRKFRHNERCRICKMCNRRYKTLEELEEHNKEPCVDGIMCDICAKIIYGPGAFKRHQLEHEEGDAHKVQCDLCGSYHKDKYALRKHKRRHLEPKTPHVCDICQKVSPSRDAMISHKKYAHKSDRAFQCEFCQKFFKRPISLREHLTTHTGAVLYTCPHCPKTFNSNANMHSHRKNVHPIEFEEARKRRKRVGYVGEQTQIAKSNISNQVSNEISELTNIKDDQQMMLYDIN